MDIKLLLTTFRLVFLAELGDKTQLATFCFSADCDNRVVRWTDFTGFKLSAAKLLKAPKPLTTHEIKVEGNGIFVALKEG